MYKITVTIICFVVYMISKFGDLDPLFQEFYKNIDVLSTDYGMDAAIDFGGCVALMLILLILSVLLFVNKAKKVKLLVSFMLIAMAVMDVVPVFRDILPALERPVIWKHISIIGIVDTIFMSLLLIVVSIRILFEKAKAPGKISLIVVLSVKILLCISEFIEMEKRVRSIQKTGIDIWELVFECVFMVGLLFLANAIFAEEPIALSKNIAILAGVVMIVLLIVCLGGLLDSSAENDSRQGTECKVCHRTFYDYGKGSNTRNITYTNMCNQCEKNYKHGMDMLDE